VTSPRLQLARELGAPGILALGHRSCYTGSNETKSGNLDDAILERLTGGILATGNIATT
jgi:hypothetical protein